MFIIFLIYSVLFFFLLIGINFKLNGKQSKYIFALSIGILTFISTIRYGVGYDYFSYQEIFFDPPDFIEWAFKLLIDVSRNIYEDSFIFFVFLTSIINQGVFFDAVCKNIAPDMYLLISYFYVTTDTYFFYLNGIRQGIAVAITFWGFRFIENKKLIHFIITTIIASLFHGSALIVIFGYYVCRKMSVKLICILYFLSFYGLYISPEQLLLSTGLLPKGYELYITSEIVENVREQLSQYSYLKLIVPNVLFLYMLVKGYFNYSRERFSYYFMYVSLYNFLGFTPIVNRVIYYFEPGLFLLIPILWANEVNRKFIFWILGLYYLIFSIITIVLLKTHGCYPFLTIFE